MRPMSNVFGLVMIYAGVCFTDGLLFILAQFWRSKHFLNKDAISVNKFRKNPMPRVGAIALPGEILAAHIAGTIDFPYIGRQADADGSVKPE